MKRTFVVTPLLVLALIAFTSLGLAKTETKSLEGTVVAITSGQITVRQNTGFFTSNVDIDIVDATKYEKLKSIKELEAGNKVKVEYYDENGKRIASLIESIEPSPAQEKGG